MAKKSGEERFHQLNDELLQLTKDQLIERELNRQGFSMKMHACVTCEHFKIHGTDYSQYYDCIHDKRDYRSPGPDYIAQNRCMNYQKMKLESCPFCESIEIEKCLVLVQSPYQRDESVPNTGYWCSACKTRFRFDGETPVIVARVEKAKPDITSLKVPLKHILKD